MAKETGFLTVNEIRQSENLNYIEGMDVINVGLSAVLYDVNTQRYYTPNTDAVGDPSSNGLNSEDDQVVSEVVSEVKDIVRKPLMVGQIQALADIVKGYQAGQYTYKQAKNMLIIGDGLSEADAEAVLDLQDNINKNEFDNTTDTNIEKLIEDKEFEKSENS